MKRSDLNTKEYPAYHGYYIELISDIHFIEALEKSESHLLNLLEPLSNDDGDFRYQPEKWSIKELIIHLIDVERIFVYRALRFARNDFTKVPGFEEDEYIVHADADHRTLVSIVEEYKAQRKSTIHFFNNLSPDALIRIPILDSSQLSVRANAYFISGHEMHHAKILSERYFLLLDK